MNDDKYIVFKRDDYDGYKWDQKYILEGFAIPDAVVIRKQDVFAPPALEGYANAITCVLEALEGVAITEETSEIIWRLRRVADYFHGQAEDAYNFQRKLPD